MDPRFWNRVDKNGPEVRPGLGPCWLWTGAATKSRASSTQSYGSVRRGGKTYNTHRYAWEDMVGPIPPGQYVLHKCDVKLCVNYERHLYLGGQVENGLDAIERGQHIVLVGEQNGMSKLRAWEVTQIRARHSLLIAYMADEFGVDRDTIRAVVCSRKTWQHLQVDFYTKPVE